MKIGRTHLQDATPIRLGQEFGGYARQVELGDRAPATTPAAGSKSWRSAARPSAPASTPTPSSPRASRHCSPSAPASRFAKPTNHFEAQSAKDAVVQLSGTLKTAAVALTKIANDIRWLGVRAALRHRRDQPPATQPGSSIMPGKVNPVMAEALCQVAAYVIGADLTVTIAGQAGNFELNVMMPVMAHQQLESIRIMAAAVRVFTDRCVVGIRAERERCAAAVEQSLAMCTALAPVIGYDAAAAIAKESFATGKTVREIARASARCCPRISWRASSIRCA